MSTCSGRRLDAIDGNGDVELLGLRIARFLRRLVGRRGEELAEVMKDPEVARIIANQGFMLSASTPEELQSFLKDQIAAWKVSVKAAGIEPE